MGRPAAKKAKMPPPPAPLVRDLLRAARQASLATSLPAATYQAWPYASLVLMAIAADGAPILLLSDLSEHAKNIAADSRVSLLIDGTAGRKDPLTGPRVSLLGRAVRADDAELKARFLARQPRAKVYAGFGDFHIYKVQVERAHFVAGFGRIHWIEAADIIGEKYGYGGPARAPSPAGKRRAPSAGGKRKSTIPATRKAAKSGRKRR
ncbi:MAG TPA: pyridoxamine 5'-phosphate oxidase family protein [Dongiaceae bacterium]|jgi:putative heme iron utilization protein